MKRGPNEQQYNIKHAKIYDSLGLVAFYNIRSGNGAGLFLQPRNPHGGLWMLIYHHHHVY